MICFVLQLPDIVSAPSLDQQLATTTTTSTTTTSSSCLSDMLYEECDGAEAATPDMDPQLLYVKLKEVTTAADHNSFFLNKICVCNVLNMFLAFLFITRYMFKRTQSVSNASLRSRPIIIKFM